MKRVVVIGSGGAGKSTFSRQLGETLGIEVIHLDPLYWQPNWVETPKDEWVETVAELIKRDSWVMDGNFGGTREMRFRSADTIIFLDIPRRVCLYRVIKRVIRYRGKTRPDMAEGCKERFDLGFLIWVWNFPYDTKRRIEEAIARFPEKNVVILRSNQEIDSFLQQGKQYVLEKW